MDAMISMPTAEAICETWGSVIQKVQQPRSQSSDGNSDDNEFGSCEDRVNVLLNGPPSGYDGTDNILRFGLESMYGVNYNSKFIVKSSKFATMSNVIDNIKAGTHEEKSGRYQAKRRILPCFRVVYFYWYRKYCQCFQKFT